MGERLKIFLIVGLLGFVAGMVAQAMYEYVFPWLAMVLPQVFQIRFFASGVLGAVLTIALISVWAYMTQSQER